MSFGGAVMCLPASHKFVWVELRRGETLVVWHSSIQKKQPTAAPTAAASCVILPNVRSHHIVQKASLTNK